MTVDNEHLHLMGVAEIAECLGVSRQRASQLTGQRTFPEPDAQLAMGPVWRRQIVEEWAANRPTRGARQRKSRT